MRESASILDICPLRAQRWASLVVVISRVHHFWGPSWALWYRLVRIPPPERRRCHTDFSQRSAEKVVALRRTREGSHRLSPLSAPSGARRVLRGRGAGPPVGSTRLLPTGRPQWLPFSSSNSLCRKKRLCGRLWKPAGPSTQETTAH